MKNIKCLTDRQYLIYRDCIKTRILELQEKAKRYKKIYDEEDGIVIYNKCVIKILRMRLRHLDEAQKLAKQMFPIEEKNEKA